METDRDQWRERPDRRVTIRRMMDLPPTLFRSDPQSVEVVSGWYIAVLSLWCWMGQWFGTFLPKFADFHGYEWVVAVLFVPYGVYHAIKAHSRNLHARSIRAFGAGVGFFYFGVMLAYNRGWEIPGFPALLLGAVVQAWAFLRLRRIIP